MPQQVTTTRNMGCAYTVLGLMILMFTIVFFFLLGLTVQEATLVWNGVSVRGTIVEAQPVNCSTKGYSPGDNYIVQFTDRTGRVQLATLHGCDVTIPATSSFTIVYAANDPQNIDLPGAMPMRLGLGLGLVIFLAIVDSLFIWLLLRTRRNQRRRISNSDAVALEPEHSEPYRSSDYAAEIPSD